MPFLESFTPRGASPSGTGQERIISSATLGGRNRPFGVFAREPIRIRSAPKSFAVSYRERTLSLLSTRRETSFDHCSRGMCSVSAFSTRESKVACASFMRFLRPLVALARDFVHLDWVLDITCTVTGSERPSHAANSTASVFATSQPTSTRRGKARAARWALSALGELLRAFLLDTCPHTRVFR